MNQALLIRRAQESDVDTIVELIHSVAHYFLASPDAKGAERFMASLSPAAISGYVAAQNFIYVLGFIDRQLVGIAAIRDGTHIYHLFVSPGFHRSGIAASLWRHLRHAAGDSGNTGVFTVNSSLYAVPVYSRFGFIPTGEPQAKNGIRFQPMQLCLKG